MTNEQLNTALNINLDKERFCQLWRRCAGVGGDESRGDSAAAIFTELAAYYQQSHRHYHTGGHINDCLHRMDLAAAVLGHSDSVEMAIWFHDVIYIPADPQNEKLSADWFAMHAGGVLSLDVIGEVEGYIMSTVHRAIPDDPGARFVVDVDLSGLGMSAAMFKRDGANIRKEFVNLSDAEFNRGQAGFLQGLLNRKCIYATSFFYDLCEVNARRNIREVLDEG